MHSPDNGSTPTALPRRKRVALGCAALLATAMVGVPVVTAVASASTDLKVLTNVAPGLSKLTDLGTVPADKPMIIGVSIPGDTAARDAAYKAMTTPGSASYGYTYTPASFAAAFGVSPSVSKAVLDFSVADGLKSVYDAKDGSYLELTGTAAQVEKTFKVSVHNYSVGGKTYYATPTGATVPTAVGEVLGLSDFDKFHLDDSQGVCSGTNCVGIVTPPALWGAYDMPDSYTEGAALKASEDYGQGQKVAIFGEGDLTQVVTDLRNFEDDTTEVGDFPAGLTSIAKPKLPHIPVVENLVNDDQSDTTGLGEWDLDSQSSTGMAPDLAQLQFYFGEGLDDASIAGIYNMWVNDASGAMIGNSSFGGCEPLEAAEGDETTDDAFFQQAVMMGRTMFTSTGDTGSGGCVVGADVNGVGNGGAPAVEYPSASPWVVAVGGTVLYTAGTTKQTQPVTRAEEYAWTYTGGGSADFETQPADQANLGAGAPNVQPCVGDGSGTPATDGAICRSVPDVDAMSGDSQTNGYGIESGSTAGKPGSGAESTGGTSLSSPLWAGMWARVRAAHSASGCASPTAVTKAGLTTVKESRLSDLGFAQPALYDIAETSSADDDAAFFDIGGTTNSQPGTTLAVGNGTYTALPRVATLNPTGYDLVSGLGTPDIGKLTLILDCGVVPTSQAVPDSETVTIVKPTAAGCPPNGTTTDESGDELPPDAALDILSVRDTGDAKQVVFTETMAGLPESDPAMEDDYDSNFNYAGVTYQIQADNGNPGGDDSVATYTLSSSVTDASSGVTTTTSLGSLNGNFDDATATVTVYLPYATFNSEAKPTTPLAPGDTLTNMEVDTTTLATQTFDLADSASFNGCNFVLPGDVTIPTPPTSTMSPSDTSSPSTSPSDTSSPSTSPSDTSSPSTSPSDTSSPSTSPSDTSSPSTSPSDTSSPSTSPSDASSPSTSPSDTSSPSTSPSDTSSPSTSPSDTSSPSTSASPSPTVTKTQTAPVPTFPTYPTPTPVATQSTPTTTTPPTRFHPLSYAPLNSRTVVNGHDEAAKVVGVAGVPATNVVDVLLQVTVDQATANVPVLVDSDFGTAAAQTAAVAVTGKTVRNVVVVTPDSQGLIRVEVTGGASARISLAVVGYDSLGAGDGFHPTFGGRVSSTVTPTTTGKKPLAVVIAGKGGVPAGSLDAALLDARVTNVSLPKKVGSATLYATVAGTSKRFPIAIITPGAPSTAVVVARPDSHGKVTFSLSAGSAKIVVNEYGVWATQSFTATHLTTAGLRVGHAMSSVTEFTGPVSGGTKTLTLTGLPAGGVSTVTLQVTVAAGAGAGEVVLATTGARFGDGSVSYLANHGASQLVSVAPDTSGRISLRLTKGTRAVSLALVGFTAPS